jgi:hypothetical protein
LPLKFREQVLKEAIPVWTKIAWSIILNTYS